MLAFAPRISPRLRDLLVRLDDRSVPIAETNRRLGAEAARLGLPRPSYQRVRELVLEFRRLKRASIALRVLLEVEVGIREAHRVPRPRFLRSRPRAAPHLGTAFLVTLCYLAGAAREFARPP